MRSLPAPFALHFTSEIATSASLYSDICDQCNVGAIDGFAS